MSNATRVIKEYWNINGCCCVLCRCDGQLELRLYLRDELIAMVPCADLPAAAHVSSQWRRRRPAWWPPYAVAPKTREDP